MAKKFGKFLLFTAVAGAAAAGAYYYFQKKAQAEADDILDGDDDYDNFSEDADNTDSSRSYIPLGKENACECDCEGECTCEEECVCEEDDQENCACEEVKEEEKVEEFFDENTQA